MLQSLYVDNIDHLRYAKYVKLTKPNKPAVIKYPANKGTHQHFIVTKFHIHNIKPHLVCYFLMWYPCTVRLLQLRETHTENRCGTSALPLFRRGSHCHWTSKGLILRPSSNHKRPASGNVGTCDFAGVVGGHGH